MFQTPYAFPNPYQMNQPIQQNQLLPSQQVVKVNGRNGADMYQMSPNSSVLLLDETAPIVWLAQTDGAGYKSLTAYDITLHQELPPVDTRDLEKRIAKLEEALNESNTSNIKRNQYDGQVRTSQANGSNAQVTRQSSSNG